MTTLLEALADAKPADEPDEATDDLGPDWEIGYAAGFSSATEIIAHMARNLEQIAERQEAKARVNLDAVVSHEAPINTELAELLLEARQYVFDAGNDEDPETHRLSVELVDKIDVALARAEAQPAPSLVGEMWEVINHLSSERRPPDIAYGVRIAVDAMSAALARFSLSSHDTRREMAKENAELAANQCIGPMLLGEGGNPYCKRIAELEAEIASLTRAGGTDLPDPRIPSRAWDDEEREAVAGLKADLAKAREDIEKQRDIWDAALRGSEEMLRKADARIAELEAENEKLAWELRQLAECEG